jgi:hypothetical protein
MTTEPTLPEETHSSTPQGNANEGASNAPRQKQNFRRRRKRRGNGGSGNPAATQNASMSNAGENTGPNPGSEAGRTQNHPRKQKKRFFKKNKGQNPGNSQQNARNRGEGRGNGNQQNRRGNKQRRPKVFVGPMDHSYRAVNGNYADAPPSTIELQRGYGNAHYNGNGNVNGNVNPEAFNGNHPRPVEGNEAAGNSGTLAGDAPTRIYCFIDDLFFVAKIQETARKLGIKVAFMKNDKDVVGDLLALPEEERPALIVFDLNSANAKPLTLIPKLKTKLKRATSIVGFLSHLQGELKVKALEAGCDTVMPRSAFSQSLPNLLRRYGMESDAEGEDGQAYMLEA